MREEICGRGMFNTIDNIKSQEEKHMTQTDEVNMALAMDSTSVIEFKFVDNTKYSQEIIEGARAAYNPDKLESLKTQQDLTAFYQEGKSQILAQWHADQALNVHTDMFRVVFQINVGEILNTIEPTFKKKAEYTAWIKDNFEDKHIRYLQQARQLADMGDFARNYAAAGKNRLLALENLRKVEKKKECEALFNKHPLPDMTEDGDGHLLKRQIDSVITLHRLQKAGLRSATFEQAALIASYNQDAMAVKTAEEVNTWLEQNPEEARPALFDRYIQDEMTYPSEHPYIPAPKASLNKILSDLLQAYENANIDDDSWIERQREVLDVKSLRSAQTFINRLIDRIGVGTETNDVSIETTATSSVETKATA